MIILDDNNSYDESPLTWWWPLQWSQHDAARLMLVDMMSWYCPMRTLMMWWSPDDGDGCLDDDCWWCSSCWWLWAITLYGGAHGLVDYLMIARSWWYGGAPVVIGPVEMMMIRCPWWCLIYLIMEPLHLMMTLGPWWRWHDDDDRLDDMIHP